MNAAASGSASGSSSVPPGFRFHPTDEELLHYYLKKKVSFEKIDLDVIRDVDLNKLEPWELHERCRIGSSPQNEWYFFSHKDKKYPTGSRTNRATAAGFWKATGRDKPIRNGFQRIGMRKTLVFYRGRAPHGLKTNWIMHEYRLDDSHNSLPGHEDGWVVCRVFKKKNQLKGGPQDEGDPLSNIENNSSPGDVLSLSEPNTDLPYSSQLNSLQLQQDQDQYQHSMNLNLRQHGETGLHYSGESISHLDCISQNPNALLQSYVHAQPRHFMMNGMKRLFPETTMEEDNASNAKRIHYSHADSFSSTTTTNSINQGQGLGLQMNELRHDSSAVQLNMNAEWSALDKLVASHMMSQGQDVSPKEMRYHGDPPSAAAAAVSLLPSADHQLTLPLRNEIDLWNFGK